jgi:hypothetical protein
VNRRHVIVGALAACLPAFRPGPAFAQTMFEAAAIPFEILGEDSGQRIRFVIPDSLINGARRPALIDTGADTTFVSGRLAEALALKPIDKRAVRTVDGTRSLDRAMAKTAQFGPVSLTDHMVIVKKTRAGVPDFLSEPEVLFGLAQFDAYTLDTVKRTLTLTATDSGDKLETGRDHTVDTLRLSHRGERFGLLLDSGSDVTIMKRKAAEHLMARSGLGVEKLYSRSDNGRTLSAFRLKSVTCGDAKLENLLIRVAPEDTPFLQTHPWPGLFGAESFIGGRWSRNGKTMRFQQLAPHWAEIRGFGFRPHHGPTTRILDIAEGSPADKAGLKVGDELRSVNGVPGGFANVDRIVREMNKSPQEAVEFEVRRDGKSFALELRREVIF